MKRILLTSMGLLCLFYSNAQETQDFQLLNLEAGTTNTYLVHAWNTNFTVPSIRVNFMGSNAGDNATVAAFNSVGAGLSFGRGRLIVSTDTSRQVITSKYKNTFSVQTGVLFAISNSGTDGSPSNIFAPVLGVNVLNFNVSLGYELGDKSYQQKPVFLAISYSVSISDLLPNSFSIVRRKNKADISDGGNYDKYLPYEPLINSTGKIFGN